MIKTSSNGNPVFDIEQGFNIEEVEVGRFAYVNHDLSLCLSSSGSKKAVEENRESYLAFEKNINQAKERYLQHFS